ncbi:RES family NAD+ phosphorylase [Erwinia sp.]|uniref:RES family NAD+ phosphorylase n=1 Tax=Erwinia citreus TaxID=558 RepID=UPI003C70A883
MADADDKEVIARKIRQPKSNLQVNFVTWPAGKRFYRVHSADYRAAEFNPGKGNSRFSPMSNGVSTLYGGENTGVAVMETLFHDLPSDSAGAPYDLGKLAGMAHSVITPLIDLQLVDLNPKTLRKMGVTRSQLLDSPAEQYIFTREYAVAIHQAFPAVQGLQWSSKQHGDAALMLFGDRIEVAQLTVEIESEGVTESENIVDAIEDEADQLGVVLIDAGGGS